MTTPTLTDINELVERLASLNADTAQPIVMTLGGPSASGKSTLMDLLAEHFGQLASLSTDDYYIGRSRMRTSMSPDDAKNFDLPEAVNLAQLAGHILSLKNGQSVERPVYDMLTSEPTGKTVPVAPQPIIVVEGIFANHPIIRQHATLTSTAWRSFEDRLARRMSRDVQRKGYTPEQIRRYLVDVAEPAYQAHCAANDQSVDFFIAR